MVDSWRKKGCSDGGCDGNASVGMNKRLLGSFVRGPLDLFSLSRLLSFPSRLEYLRACSFVFNLRKLSVQSSSPNCVP